MHTSTYPRKCMLCIYARLECNLFVTAGVVQGDLATHTKFVSLVRNVEYLQILELEKHLAKQFRENCRSIVEKETGDIPKLPRSYIAVLVTMYLENRPGVVDLDLDSW